MSFLGKMLLKYSPKMVSYEKKLDGHFIVDGISDSDHLMLLTNRVIHS